MKRGSGIKPPPALPVRDVLASFDEHYEMIRAYQQRFTEWSDKCKEEYGSMDDQAFEALGPTSIARLLKAFNIRVSKSTVLNKWRWRQFCGNRAVLKPKNKTEFLPPPRTYLMLPHNTRYDQMEGLQRIPINVVYAHILPLFDDPRDIASLMLTCRQFQKMCHCKLLLLAQQRYGQDGASPKAILLECALRTNMLTQKMLRLTPRGYALANSNPTKLVQQVILEHGCVDYLSVASKVMQEQRDAMAMEQAFIVEQSVLRMRIVNDCLASAGLDCFTLHCHHGKISIPDERVEKLLNFLWYRWVDQVTLDVKVFVTLKKDTFNLCRMDNQSMLQIALESDLDAKFFRNDWYKSWVLKRIGHRLIFDRLFLQGEERDSFWRYVCSRRFLDEIDSLHQPSRMVWFLHEPEHSRKLRFYTEKDVEFYKLSKSSLPLLTLHYITDYVANPMALPEECTPLKRQKLDAE